MRPAFVVDLGCAEIGTETSVEKLIHRFYPRVLFGFDPQIRGGIEEVERAVVIRSPLAAWMYDGTVSFTRAATRSRVAINEPNVERVPCFDLNSWLATLPRNEEVVVKMDVEGAEYDLLPRLCYAPRLPNLVLVEWHGHPFDFNLPFDLEVWE